MAFAACTELREITIPGGTVQIGGLAFNNCTQLRIVSVPESVCQIAEDAFANCPDVTLKVKPGSEAEKYAEENGIRYFMNADTVNRLYWRQLLRRFSLYCSSPAFALYRLTLPLNIYTVPLAISFLMVL